MSEAREDHPTGAGKRQSSELLGTVRLLRRFNVEQRKEKCRADGVSPVYVKRDPEPREVPSLHLSLPAPYRVTGKIAS